MKRKLLAVITIGATVAVTGCARTSSILPADQSQSGFEGAFYEGTTTVFRDDVPDSQAFRVFHQGASNYVPVSAVQDSVKQRAKEFCAAKEKRYLPLRETVSPGAFLPGNYPRAELVFACIRAEQKSTTDYDKLRELKKLQSEGIITQSEFEAEKRKILSKGAGDIDG